MALGIIDETMTKYKLKLFQKAHVPLGYGSVYHLLHWADLFERFFPERFFIWWWLCSDPVAVDFYQFNNYLYQTIKYKVYYKMIEVLK